MFENLLESLPTSAGRLTSLCKLQLQKNQLQTLPSTLCHLKSLRELEVLTVSLNSFRFLFSLAHVAIFLAPLHHFRALSAARK